MKTAQEEILQTYDRLQLRDISEYGCATGCASAHIYYSQTLPFFSEHEEEIQDDLMSRYGDEFLTLFARDVQDIATMQNNMVWDYIESVACNAQSYITA